MERISEEKLTKAIERVAPDLYVYWTGGDYNAQRGSLRSESLGTIREVGEPVPVQDLLRRAARIDGEIGFDPYRVRQGLRLHQGQQPCVYWLLRKEPNGSYSAAGPEGIPDADLAARPIPTGEIVLNADRHLVIPLIDGPRARELRDGAVLYS